MKSSNIGGQAVLEGIMMKNKTRYAVAVRKPDQQIEVCVKEYKGIIPWQGVYKVPFRGTYRAGRCDPNGSLSFVYWFDFQNEGYSEDVYVSWGRAQVYQLH